LERGLQSASKPKAMRLEVGSPLINPSKEKRQEDFFSLLRPQIPYFAQELRRARREGLRKFLVPYFVPLSGTTKGKLGFLKSKIINTSFHSRKATEDRQFSKRPAH
jgi:hypothetical protein